MPISMAERISVLLRHIQTMCDYKGEAVGMREARKHAAWYFKGVKGAASLRRQSNSLTTFNDLIDLCKSLPV